MAGSDDKPKSGKISLHRLTPDEALAAALRVKPEDLKKREAEEKAKKAKRKGPAARRP